MQEIKTLVYFDLEATGLKSSGRPRVCEISLVAVNTCDFLNLHAKIMDQLKTRRKEDNFNQVEALSPRVINKLTLCVYPMATIVPLVTTLTGLDNYNLTGQTKFDKGIGDMLNIFLSRLPSPVCLVAHNGNLYDFPLLRAEIEKTGTELGSQILCVDSYVGMKEIFKKRGQKNETRDVENKKIEMADVRSLVKKEVEAVTVLINDGEFEKDMQEGTPDRVNLGPKIERKETRLDQSSCTLTESDGKRKYQESTSSSDEWKRLKISKQKNESTPSKSNRVMASNVPSKSRQVSSSQNLEFRKKLNFSSMPTSFSLINLHKHLLGCTPIQSHGAEADCLALMRVTAVLGEEWLGWVQDNCSRFQHCKQMWSMPGK